LNENVTKYAKLIENIIKLGKMLMLWS